jgi:hypothetical protein
MYIFPVLNDVVAFQITVTSDRLQDKLAYVQTYYKELRVNK